MPFTFDAEEYTAGMERIASEAERRVRDWAYTDDGTDREAKAKTREALEKRRA